MLKNLFIQLCFLFAFQTAIYTDQVYFTEIFNTSLVSAPEDIIIYNGIAYVTTKGALYSFNITDPYKIVQGSLAGLNGTKSIAFTGRFAYALRGNEINYYDLTLEIPVLKNTLQTNGTLSKLTIDNGFLYVINQDAGLQVYDVNIADFPVFKNTQIFTGEANGIFIKNKKAYITSSNAHLSIIDVENVSLLPIIGTYTNGTYFREAFVDENYAYVPQGKTGVQVLNISKLPFPEWVANLYARKFAKQVVSSNFYVWVADEKSVEGFFNKDPGAFYFAGNYKNGAVINRIAVVEGKYILIASADKKFKVLKIEYRY